MLKLIHNNLFNPSKEIIKYISRGAYWSKKTGFLKYIREYYKIKTVKKFSCYISPKAQIPSTTYFPHPTGIVIGDGVVIGDNCTIYQNVTIGALRRGEGKLMLYPKIGQNVIIYSGAVVVGNIEIGDYSVVGANSFVSTSIPAHSISVGSPAKYFMKCKKPDKNIK